MNTTSGRRSGRTKVVAVTWSDIDALHRKITKAGHTTQANRVIAGASKMFALAVSWQMRADNPAKGIERNPERKRKRYHVAPSWSVDSGARPRTPTSRLPTSSGCAC